MSKSGNNKAPAPMSSGANEPLLSETILEGAPGGANHGRARTKFGDNPLNSGDAERASTSRSSIIPMGCSSSPSKAASLAAKAIGFSGRKVSFSPVANAKEAIPQSPINAVEEAVSK